MTADQRAAVAGAVLARSTADAAQVTVDFSRQGLTRFTHDTVTQNIDQTDTSVHVRAIVGGRVGIAATNAFDDAALADVVAHATAIAKLAPRETIARQLAGPADALAPAGAFVPATAAATPADRARIAGAIFAGATDGMWPSGYAMTATRGVTIATSNGARASFDGTDAGVNVKMNAPDSTGFAEHYSCDTAALDGGALGREAARIARETRSPLAVDPGDWTVILAPAAAGELLRYLITHFSAEAFSDGSSFIAGKLGAPVLAPNVTIRDDYRHPLNPGMPFDFEGFPTSRVTLIDRGIAADLVTDSTWSQRLDRPNTGHALPAPNSTGPQASYAVVEAGTKPLDMLIAETKRGLLVTRLWYVRVVDVRSALLTGMTRDGTFLIENGVVRGGVRNMRFNESIVRALNDCELSDTQTRTGSYLYSLVTPAIKFNHVRFASASPY
jgi:predicted Zn-dependent protease